MTRYELELRVEHDCPYTRFSKQLPNAITMHWCNNDKDVLEISTPEDIPEKTIEKELDELEHDLRAQLIRKVVVDPMNRILVYRHKSSSLKENVNAIIEQCNSVEIQPTVYRGGSEWYRIICFNGEDLQTLYSRLASFANVKTVSKEVYPDSSIKNNIMIRSSTLLGKLTRKQEIALRTALALGYFDIPSRTTSEFLAHEIGVSRSTFEEHLRKAEGKILKSVLPYLEMQ
jgi:predicted DNA binding protein